MLAEQSIDFVANVSAETIDRSTRTVSLSNGTKLRFSKLLLATGASPRRLDNVEGKDGIVLYLRTFFDALTLRERLQPATDIVIVGGGFIGLEIAASAVARGCRVTLLEAASRLLMRGVPEVIANRIAAKQREAGVKILISVEIESILGCGSRYALKLKDGKVFACDLVVAGIGAIPKTRLAATSALSIDNGFRVDDRLQSEDSDIFAAGDCCSFPHPLYAGRRIRLYRVRRRAVVLVGSIRRDPAGGRSLRSNVQHRGAPAQRH